MSLALVEPQTDTTLRDAALEYGRRGWPIFPLQPGTKIPFQGTAGFKDATCDLKEIEKIWTVHPDANIGMATGVVADILDVDSKHDIDGAASLKDWADGTGLGSFAIPDGPRVFTPNNGVHYWVQPTGAGNRTAALPGVDWRGNGGYVLLPGSVLPGGSYEWGYADAPIPEASEPLRRLVLSPAAIAPTKQQPMVDRLKRISERPSGEIYGEAALRGQLDALAQSTPGQRNHDLNGCAYRVFRLVRRGDIDKATAEEGLRATALDLGLTESEIKATLASASAAAMQAAPLPPLDDITATAPARVNRATGEIIVDEWPEATPLEAVAELPAFPLKALPQWMADYVEGVSTEKQVAPDLAALIGLAVIATTVGGYVFADVRPGWTEPTNLYVLVALPSGERKSPIVAEATLPLCALEAELIEANRDGVARAKADADVAKQVAEDAKKNAAKGNMHERLAAMAEVHIAAEEAARLADAIPAPPRILAEDITPEALGGLLAEQQGRLGMFSAEGGVFDSMAGRYDSRRGKGPASASLDVWLKSYSGESIRIDRKGNLGPQRVERACLTIGVAVQPDLLNGLADVPGFKSRGLLGRFLMALPVSNLGRRDEAPPACDPDLKSRWLEWVLAIGRETRRRQGQISLTFTEDAVRGLVGFMAGIEPRLGPGGDLSDMPEWAAKLHGQIARLAVLLHLAELGVEGLDQPVTVESVERALLIGDYLIPHALAAHDLMGTSETRTKARKALEIVRNNQWETVRPRDLMRASRFFQNAHDAKEALAELAEYQWLRETVPGQWDVNPAALQ